jgi:hypothetical protein
MRIAQLGEVWILRQHDDAVADRFLGAIRRREPHAARPNVGFCDHVARRAPCLQGPTTIFAALPLMVFFEPLRMHQIS